jgi:glutamate dehydrogenase
VALAQQLGLARLAPLVEQLPASSYWQSRAKSALSDDLASLQRQLSQEVLAQGAGEPEALLAQWQQRNSGTLERAQRLLADLADTKGADLAMLSVAMRELRNLV